MTRFISRSKLQKAMAIAWIVVALGSGSRSLAQMSPDRESGESIPQQPSAFSANELANLVAPVALYPDALLGQVLVACTYPLEVVEAQQWLQQNGNLHNGELMEQAQQQNWDPSVQALVAFPDVVALLNRNIRWTTDLGNAFLGQQADVMNAIQGLRTGARENGQLPTTPQLSVNTAVQGDQSAIEIQPADPQRMYVPNYDPSAVWGAPSEGSYPALPYNTGSGFGSLFGTVANLAGLLPGFGGLLGPRSWGWTLSWLAQALFLNNSFFDDFGFHNSAGVHGEASLWVHNPHHRLGVPYGSDLVASRYGGEAVLARRGDSRRRTFANGTNVGPVKGPQRPSVPHPSTDRESFQRNSRRDNWTEKGGNWRTFGGGERTASAGQSGRTFSQPSRTFDRGPQTNRSAGRDSYFANSADNRARSFPGSRSFASSRDRFADPGTTRSPERSRATSSSWGRTPHFSPARMSSHHGFWSQHSGQPKHFSAPRFSAFHSSKSHGGGHSSRGHSGGKSHRK